LQFFPAGLFHPAGEGRVIGIYLMRFVKAAAILTDKAEVVDPGGAVALRVAERRLEHCSLGGNGSEALVAPIVEHLHPLVEFGFMSVDNP
jgi:hypothetical protein